MCDTFSANYVAQLNTFDPASSDLIPTTVLFLDPNCGGTFFPEAGSSVPSNVFQTAQSIVRDVDFNFIPASIFIPFNFSYIIMYSSSGQYMSTFLGPVTLPNLQLVRWMNINPSGTTPIMPTMLEDPVLTITFKTVEQWSAALFTMCMGETRYVNGFPLSRFYPQSERCDYFMTNQFCSVPLNQTQYADACACIVEQPALEAKGAKVGVPLPVVCFGTQCATQLSYKTNNMMAQPCNLTICQQVISSSPGIINQGQDTIFCGGQFFKTNGTLIVPSVTPQPDVPNSGKGEDNPFYVWVMLGVSATLFVILIVLLFTEKPKKEVSVLRQLRKLQSRQQIPNLARPALGSVTETEATVDY